MSLNTYGLWKVIRKGQEIADAKDFPSVQEIIPKIHAACVANFDHRYRLLYVTMPTFFFIRWEILSIWTLEGGKSKFDREENPPGGFKLWKKIRFL